MSGIVELRIQNVKRIEAAEIRPDGSIITVGGRNAAGKSSVLDSIMYALAGGRSLPPRPVRDGTDEAEVVVELGDLTVRRVIRPDGRGSLVVTSAAGARYPSPQAMLDRLFGALCFDPLAFCAADPKRQAAQLRELVGLDVSDLEAERSRVYADRATLNKRGKERAAVAAAMPHYPDAPAEAPSARELMAQLGDAEASQKRATRARRAADLALRGVRDAESEVEELERRLAAARAALERCAEAAKTSGREAQLADAAAVDPDPIRAELEALDEVAERVAANDRRAEALADVAELREQSAGMTERLKAIDDERAARLAACEMPLTGLDVGEAGVLYRGVPLEQASSAEQMRVSVAIGIALSGERRVMLIRDGSLLDSASMTQLAALAEEHDAQLWIERVAEPGEDGAYPPCSVIIEDGRVLAEACDA